MLDIKSLLHSDMNLLICLHVLLEERSVSQAAKRMHLTQSAISKQLTRLRVLFDDPLFERVSKGLLPTPKAVALAPKIHQILVQVEQLAQLDEFIPNDSQRSFHFELVETAYSAIYTQSVITAMKQAPSITLNAQTWNEQSLERLVRREADFGIGMFEYDSRAKHHIATIPKELQYQELFRDHSVCLMHPKHPALQQPWNLDTFVSHRHIHVVTGGVGRWLLMDLLDQQSKSLDKAILVSDMNSAVEMCQHSDLLMCYPYKNVKHLVDNGTLVMKPLPLKLEPGGLFLIWHKHFDQDQGHQWMRQQIIDQSSVIH
ncbi:LysR substrate-binding domain-containing protein [Vibrio hippocampi]|uniref:HTH-type transcriptional regulator YidZ n=1 Tax=Vibrio hippocampi TaxID=654686 RepID=A0ABN8DHC7_9VIBR|nr:LysR substrate-binding domain-containing protein [Vibrio hippocampi]CAH0525742.1 HTH-type transcriptional regulator YidZ [Vibrio hippocampi]